MYGFFRSTTSKYVGGQSRTRWAIIQNLNVAVPVEQGNRRVLGLCRLVGSGTKCRHDLSERVPFRDRKHMGFRTGGILAGRMQIICTWRCLREYVSSRSAGEVEMLSRCANHQCLKPFLRLREGKLFLVETGRPKKLGPSRGNGSFPVRELQPRIERFWLCDECALHWTLICDREQGVLLAPLRKPAASVPVTKLPQGAMA